MKLHLKARVAKRRPRAKTHRKRPLLPEDAQRREQRLASTLGMAVREARMRAGLTQAELAESIGTATEVYGRLERGKMLPSVPTLFRLCVALRSGPHELMGFAPVGSVPEAARLEVPPELADTPEMRRLRRLLGRLQGLQLRLILRLVMAFLTEPKRTRRQGRDRR
ncbi:helix-turn-helix transcriptional regulator [Stigmatella hybrida]|uniref:helix-turn-helix transcriptional regulator n=1 Tax=Stigmatella hybrida TaxID=394097 RepID=UPI001CDAC7B2|nr:helix-turn-helix transcriptional regulator [Stigmatella hybrida]